MAASAQTEERVVGQFPVAYVLVEAPSAQELAAAPKKNQPVRGRGIGIWMEGRDGKLIKPIFLPVFFIYYCFAFKEVTRSSSFEEQRGMKIGRKTVAEWVKDNETAPYPTPDASERYLKGEYILLLVVFFIHLRPIFYS